MDTILAGHLPGIYWPRSGDPAGVVAEQMVRLRRPGVRRPGRHDPGGQQAGQGEPAATNMASAVRWPVLPCVATSVADTMATPSAEPHCRLAVSRALAVPSEIGRAHV